MEPSNSEFSMPIESCSALSIHHSNSSQTEIKVEHVKHSWTVKNFSHCYQEYLENFVHLHRGEDTLTWSIKIYPKGNGENNKDFVFLCLNRVVNNTASSCTKNGKIGFKSRFILRTHEMKEIEMRIHPNPSHSDYVSYIKRDVLFPQILPNDSIIVNVEIDVAVETVTTTVDDLAAANAGDLALREDYMKMLRDGVLTDFVIRVQGREIKAHRAILAARSPVFAAMLCTHEDTNEAKTGVVVIEDLDYETVNEMLNFIYCGRCIKDFSEFSFASDLLIAADKYGLEELKSRCERALVQALTYENACDLLVISDVYRAQRLRQRAVEYIIQHPLNITSTAGWDNIVKAHHDLVTEIVRHFDKSEK
uniref:BTB domain-containing protein n=1 Tax=Syphacia muris TaxID=451379 RepID=A0A0N5AB14_9BILA